MQSRILDIDTALLTARTVVRRFREGDGKLFFELVRDNHAWLIDHFPTILETVTDKEQGEFYVRQCLSAWLLQEAYSFGIWEHESARLVGMIRLFHIDWSVPKAELSFFIDQGFGGRGLMTEALLTVTRFAFEQLLIEKLNLRTAMDNYASQRLARKCGFRREGDLRDDVRRQGGELIDSMLFGFTRAEFTKA